jgi:hypothetical protein
MRHSISSIADETAMFRCNRHIDIANRFCIFQRGHHSNWQQQYPCGKLRRSSAVPPLDAAAEQERICYVISPRGDS